MPGREKIQRLWPLIQAGLEEVGDDYCLIGSGALALSGASIEIHDLDILTSRGAARKLKDAWAPFTVEGFKPNHPEMFRSEFGRFEFSGMPVEVMGDLEVCRDGRWHPVRVQSVQIIILNGKSIRIPTPEEQKRIFRLLGRPKDLEKAAMVADKTGA